MSSLSGYYLRVKCNSKNYDFYTWISKRYFYKDIALIIENNYILEYAPLIPIDDLINAGLEEYISPIHVKLNNKYYTLLFSTINRDNNTNDGVDLNVQSPSSGFGTFIFTVTMDKGSAQRIGMRYKLHLTSTLQSHSTETLSTSLQETDFYNSKETVALLGDGIYTVTFTTTRDRNLSAEIIGDETETIQVLKFTSDEFSSITFNINFTKYDSLTTEERKEGQWIT